MREQVDRVPSHEIGAIVGGRMELFALPVAAIVERHDAAPGLRQRFDPTRVHPVDAMAGGEAMDQQDRLAKVMRPRRDIDERDLDPIRRETPELGGAANSPSRMDRCNLRLR